MSSKLCCHPCSRKGLSSAADKYCTDCDEILCMDCITAHNSFKAFTSHCLVDSNMAPSSKLSIQKFCSKHQDMALDFFCADHDCLCCLLCMSESHRVCQKFVPLDVAAKGVKRSAMFEDVYSTLSNIQKTLAKMLATRENNIKGLANDGKKVLTEFAVVKADILKKLDEAEDQLKLQVKSTARKYHSKIETQKGSISQLANSVDEITRQIDFASEHGAESQVFILMNACKWEILRHDTKIREIIPTLETTRILFSRDDFDIWSLKAFGTIQVESYPCDIKYTATKVNQAQVLPPLPHVPIQEPTTSRVPTKFSLDRQIDIKSTDSVWITGIAVTDDNRLLLCNINSNKLLVYSDRGDYKQDCTLVGKPWDIAVISREDRAVVSLDSLQKIQFIDTKTTKAGSTHSVPSYCYGITVVYDKICIGGKGEIYILNKQGKHETTITLRDVIYIYYLHPGPRDSVYYTAYDENTAGCVKLSGEILFTYTNENFKGPEAVVTDNGGNIYIACKDSNNIHRLTSEGKCTDVILTMNNGIDRPYGLAFSKDYRELFVSNNDGKHILVFSCK